MALTSPSLSFHPFHCFKNKNRKQTEKQRQTIQRKIIIQIYLLVLWNIELKICLVRSCKMRMWNIILLIQHKWKVKIHKPRQANTHTTYISSDVRAFYVLLLQSFLFLLNRSSLSQECACWFERNKKQNDAQIRPCTHTKRWMQTRQCYHDNKR